MTMEEESHQISHSGTWDLVGQPVTGVGQRVLRASLGKDSSVLVVW